MTRLPRPGALPDGSVVERVALLGGGGEALRITRPDGTVLEVCAACGGNCGQCGWSVGAGVQASMDCLVAGLHARPPSAPPPAPPAPRPDLHYGLKRAALVIIFIAALALVALRGVAMWASYTP